MAIFPIQILLIFQKALHHYWINLTFILLKLLGFGQNTHEKESTLFSVGGG